MYHLSYLAGQFRIDETGKTISENGFRLIGASEDLRELTSIVGLINLLCKATNRNYFYAEEVKEMFALIRKEGDQDNIILNIHKENSF